MLQSFHLVSDYYIIFATDATKKPGPGAHCPEKVTITKKASPSHSMGIRHSEYTCPLIIDVSD